MKIVTPFQAKEIERIAGEVMDLKVEVLIERAAKSFIEVLKEDFSNLDELKIHFLFGPGNNGKDARKVSQLLGKSKENIPLGSCDIVVDGMFGIGLNRQLNDIEQNLIDEVNKSGKPVYSIDVPSGVNALTGEVLGRAIQAFKTVTFFGCKPGMLFGDGKDCAGKIYIKDLGLSDVKKIEEIYSISEAKFNPKLLFRKSNTHKGVFGSVLIVAGSDNMRGAASLAAMGAFAAGAGLVYVATTERVWNSVSVIVPEAIGVIMIENDEGGIAGSNAGEIISIAKKVDAVIAGPGMMKCGDTKKIVKRLINDIKTPLILDADALNSIISSYIKRPLLITPHIGEMERISKETKEKIISNRIQFLTNFCDKNNCVTLLKGSGTIVCSPDAKLAINTSGNPGMAVAGSGDVLSGILVALLAQGQDLFDAASGGANLHGMAGDLAALEKGQLSMTASDIARNVSKACLQIETEIRALNGAK